MSLMLARLTSNILGRGCCWCALGAIRVVVVVEKEPDVNVVAPEETGVDPGVVEEITDVERVVLEDDVEEPVVVREVPDVDGVVPEED